MQAPTANELMQHAVVQQALDKAWLDSLPGDALGRHEEGGWIYCNPTSGEIVVKRAPQGGQAAIDLSQPPILSGLMVVAKFHTHPNPSAEGWNPGPSPGDQLVDSRHGVPDLIRADNGLYVSGPDSRRGGLNGAAGFPA